MLYRASKLKSRIQIRVCTREMRNSSANISGPSYSSAKLYGQNLKEVGAYEYLELPSGVKGLDTRSMRGASIDKGVRTASLLYSAGCNGGGFSTAVGRRMLTSLVCPSMEYDRALVNLSKRQ